MFLLQFSDVDTWRRVRPQAIESVLEILRLLGRPASPAQLDAAWSGHGTQELYRWILDQLPPGTRLLDKTPAYATRRETLDAARILEPFCLWLIRHPLGAVDSHLRLKQQDGSAPQRMVKRMKDRVQRALFGGLSRKGRRRENLWVSQNGNIRDFLRTVPANLQHRLSFENLVQQPGVEIEQVCTALGLDYSPTMLEQPARNIQVIPGLGDPNFGRDQEISPATADGWRSRYSAGALAPNAAKLMAEIWQPLHAGDTVNPPTR